MVLAIGFDDDDIIENAESYVFSIINVNKIPAFHSPALVCECVELLSSIFLELCDVWGTEDALKD